MTAEEIADGKSVLCRSILEGLPDWFGIPESIDRYVAEVAHLPMFGIRLEGQVAGFISRRKTIPSNTSFQRAIFACSAIGLLSIGWRSHSPPRAMCR